MHDLVIICQLVNNATGEVEDFRVIDCNNAYANQVGKPKNEIIGKLISEVLLDKNLLYKHEYEEVVRTGISKQFYQYNERYDKFFLSSISHIGGDRFSIIASDVTEIKRSQELYEAKNIDSEACKYDL